MLHLNLLEADSREKFSGKLGKDFTAAIMFWFWDQDKSEELLLR